MPAEYRKCITNIIFSFKKSEVQPQLTKKLYYNEYMLITYILIYVYRNRMKIKCYIIHLVERK